MSNIKTLKNIANIIPGYLFRTKIIPSTDANYNVILMSNINNDNTINYNELIKTRIDKIKPQQIVRKNDIIFKSKGNNNFASFIDIDIKNTIASAHFFIIRITDKSVLPEYIAWYLNQKPAQQYFTKFSAGTVIPLITTKNLENLKIILPDIGNQQMIINMYNLMRKEENLICEILHKRKLLIKNLLIEKINMEAKKDASKKSKSE